MANSIVAIVIGSTSDWKVVEHSFQTLKKFGITVAELTLFMQKQ